MPNLLIELWGIVPMKSQTNSTPSNGSERNKGMQEMTNAKRKRHAKNDT